MVHGIPFIYMSVNVYDDWNHQWNMEPFMWTGVVALVAHAYLVLTSWGIFRNAQYEIFKKLVVYPFTTCTELKTFVSGFTSSPLA